MTAATDNPTPTRGVPLVLDKERHLRYTIRTSRMLREDSEIDVGDDPHEIDLSKFKVDVIGRVLYYGLIWEDPDITVEEVEDLVDFQNVEEVSLAIAEAFGVDLETAKKRAEEAAKESGKPDASSGAKKEKKTKAKVKAKAT